MNQLSYDIESPKLSAIGLQTWTPNKKFKEP